MNGCRQVRKVRYRQCEDGAAEKRMQTNETGARGGGGSDECGSKSRVRSEWVGGGLGMCTGNEEVSGRGAGVPLFRKSVH